MHSEVGDPRFSGQGVDKQDGQGNVGEPPRKDIRQEHPQKVVVLGVLVGQRFIQGQEERRILRVCVCGERERERESDFHTECVSWRVHALEKGSKTRTAGATEYLDSMSEVAARNAFMAWSVFSM